MLPRFAALVRGRQPAKLTRNLINGYYRAPSHWMSHFNQRSYFRPNILKLFYAAPLLNPSDEEKTKDDIEEIEEDRNDSHVESKRG